MLKTQLSSHIPRRKNGEEEEGSEEEGKEEGREEERRQEALIRAATRFPGCSPSGGHPNFFKEFRATGHGNGGRGCRDAHVEYQQVAAVPC